MKNLLFYILASGFWEIPNADEGNSLVQAYNRISNVIYGYILYPIIGLISLVLLFEIIIIGVKLKKAGEQSGEENRKEAKSKMLNCFLAMMIVIGSSTILPLIIKGILQAFSSSSV